MRQLSELDKIKIQGLELSRDRFDRNREVPQLQQLFLEVTPRCNLSCIHCGSRCDEHTLVEEVSLDEYKRILSKARDDFGERLFVVLTGGEPLLREDVCELGRFIADLGLAWGMTTNGTLIDPEMAERLVEAGLLSVSISIDGTAPTHDAVRRCEGAYEKAMEGTRNLAATGRLKALQITSVMNHTTMDEIDSLFDIMVDMPIDSWRLASVEPIGSALLRPDILMTPADYARLFSFIKEKREQQWPVEYGCCHYLGLGYEGELRNWFWLCSAGLHVMSVMHNGDIGSCLDIERRPETVFGNIRTDDLADVWRDGFGIWRTPNSLADRCGMCRGCSEKRWCRGDAAHSWDYDRNEPRICMLRDLPEFVRAGNFEETDPESVG